MRSVAESQGYTGYDYYTREVNVEDKPQRTTLTGSTDSSDSSQEGILSCFVQYIIEPGYKHYKVSSINKPPKEIKYHEYYDTSGLPKDFLRKNSDEIDDFYTFEDTAEKVSHYSWVILVDGVDQLPCSNGNSYPIICLIDLEKYYTYTKADKEFKSAFNTSITQNKILLAEKKGDKITKIFMHENAIKHRQNQTLCAIGECVFDVLKDRNTGEYVRRAKFGNFENFAIKQIQGVKIGSFTDGMRHIIRAQFRKDFGFPPETVKTPSSSMKNKSSGHKGCTIL